MSSHHAYHSANVAAKSFWYLVKLGTRLFVLFGGQVNPEEQWNMLQYLSFGQCLSWDFMITKGNMRKYGMEK